MRFLSGIIIGLLCVNTFAFELYFGGVDGAGGQSVKCTDEQDASNVTYELWDFKESSILYNLNTKQKFNDMSVKDIVLDRVQHFAEVIDENLDQHRNDVTELMTHLRFIKGADLKPIDDDASVILPDNCEVQQLANYHSKKNIFVSEEIYEKLDNVNKAGLVLHEYIYALERSRGAKTSTRTRRIVAYLFSQNEELEKVSFLTEADLKVAQFCSTDLLVSQQSRIDFYAVPQPDGSTRLDFIRLGNQLQYSKTSTVIPGEFPSEFNDDRYILNSNFDNESEIRLSSEKSKFFIATDTVLPPYLQTKAKEYKCTSAESFRTKGIVLSLKRNGRPLKALKWKANIGDKNQQSVWVKNKYHKPVKHIQLDSDYLQVKVKENKCPEILKPHRSCEVVLQFKASKPATKFEADLQINYLVKRKIKRKTVLMKFDVSEKPVVPAVLSISDGPLFDFGLVAERSTRTHVFTVTNSFGNEAATNLKSTSLARPFRFTGGTYPGNGTSQPLSPACGLRLESGATCEIEVEFTPTFRGAILDDLVIEYFNGTEFVNTTREIHGAATEQASLLISGVDPYDYGAVTLGATGEVLFSVTNIGGVSAVDVADSSSFRGSFNYKGGVFPGLGGSCGSSLAPGVSCTINVTFKPDQVGLFVDTIQLNYNDGVDTVTASRDITGAGEAAALISIDNALFDFGTVVIGSKSIKTFTLTNAAGGSTAVNLKEVGLAAPFGFVGGSFPGIGTGLGKISGCVSGGALAPGQSCEISIEYSPTVSGLDSGSIELRYFNGVSTVSSIRLVQGTGVYPGFLTISDGPMYDFGVIGLSSYAKKIFTITNSGSSSVFNVGDGGVLGGAFQYVGGTFPGSNGTCTSVISAMSSCTVAVEFVPTANFVHSGTLSINYNDGITVNSSLRDLIGTGANPATLKFKPKAIDFGILLLGHQVSRVIQVSNVGGLTATNISSSGLMGRPFLFKNGYPGSGVGTPCGATLAPGATCDIAITFAPEKAGNYTSTLGLNYDSGAGAQMTSLNLIGKSFDATKMSFSLKNLTNGSVSFVTQPTVAVSNLTSSVKVNLYDNSSTCVQPAVVGVSTGELMHLTVVLKRGGGDDGLHTFYVSAVDDYGNSSACVDTSLSYTLDTTAPLGPQNLQMNYWSAVRSSSPVIAWEKSPASDAVNYLVKLYDGAPPALTSRFIPADGPLTTSFRLRTQFTEECTEYSIGVSAVDAAGLTSLEYSVPFKIDATAPRAPANLSAEHVQARFGSAKFNWQEASDNCKSGISYQIRFSKDQDKDGQLDVYEEGNMRDWFTAGTDITSFQDSLIKPEPDYKYFMDLRAVDAAGNISYQATIDWYVLGGDPQRPKLIGNWETGLKHSSYRDFIGTELMYLNVSYEAATYAQLNKVRYGASELQFVGASTALASNGFRTTTEVWICDNACLYEAQNNSFRYKWSGDAPRESNIFSSHALFKNVNQAEPINNFVQASNLSTTDLTVSGLQESQFSMSLMSCMHGSITEINWTDGSWVAQIPQTGGGSASTARSAVRYPGDSGVHTATVMSSQNYRFVCAAVNLNTSWSYN